MQNLVNFIGIDISKQTLDICIIGQDTPRHHQIKNCCSEIKKFFGNKAFSKAHICFENTGRYGWELIDSLSKLNLKFYQINALHLKRSIGLVRGKDDCVDALRIAQFISKNHTDLEMYKQKDSEIEKMQVLMSKRNLLVKQRSQHKALKKENKLLKSLGLPTLDKHTAQIIELLSKQILEIESLIQGIVEKNQRFHKNHQIVTSIPGIGKIVSWNMMVKTNGYTSVCDPRKFACFTGVAPFSQQSGTSINKRARVSHLADKSMKKLLHMAAMRAIQMENDLKHYYVRKVEQGKNKMSVINAIRNKIIHRIFAMVKNQNFYEFNLHLS